jgi:hypothetical protein
VIAVEKSNGFERFSSGIGWGMGVMGWGKIGALCSAKAIVVACFLTPATVTVLPSTPAYAQFQIIIPGFGYGYRGGRRYGRSSRYYRHSRRGGRRGGGGGEASAAPSSGSSVSGSGSSSSGGKKIRGTSD